MGTNLTGTDEDGDDYRLGRLGMGTTLTGMDGDKYPFRCSTAGLYSSCRSSCSSSCSGCSSIGRCFSSGAREHFQHPQFSFTIKRHLEVSGDELGLELY